MLITVKYFGLIAEITQCENEAISFDNEPVLNLLNVLYDKYPALNSEEFQVAQNQELITLETILTGNEIALLPPFAGG